MTGLIPVIHADGLREAFQIVSVGRHQRSFTIETRLPWPPAWMTGTSPVMTSRCFSPAFVAPRPASYSAARLDSYWVTPAVLIGGLVILVQTLLAWDGDPKLYDFIPLRHIFDTVDIAVMAVFPVCGTIEAIQVFREIDDDEVAFAVSQISHRDRGILWRSRGFRSLGGHCSRDGVCSSDVFGFVPFGGRHRNVFAAHNIIGTRGVLGDRASHARAASHDIASDAFDVCCIDGRPGLLRRLRLRPIDARFLLRRAAQSRLGLVDLALAAP